MEIGTIVTICLPGSSYHGAQGKVVGHDAETKELLVILGPKHEYLVGYCATEEEKQRRFKESDLRKDDDWSPENKATLLFGTRFQRIEMYRHAFTPGKECICEGCSNKATERIMVNVWGTVVEEDVCAEHALQYHGKCIDGPFPNKRLQIPVEIQTSKPG